MDTVQVPKEKAEREIVVKLDVATGAMSLSGCDADPVVALGMLDYALARVRRSITMGDIQREVQEASRILPGSALRQ